MIIHFADRGLSGIGVASDALRGGVLLASDLLRESVKAVYSTFECDVVYENRQLAEECTKVGNFILMDDNEKTRCFTIIETEQDIAASRINVYCEEAGLDLINDVAEAYASSDAKTPAEYLGLFLAGTGFAVGESGVSAELKLSFPEQTVAERVTAVCDAFGCEARTRIEYSGKDITGCYVDLYQEVGTDNGEVISLYTNLNNITISSSISNLATALIVEGADNTGLTGYTYDDGDFYVDGKVLKSRDAVRQWARYYPASEGYIYRKYKSDIKASTTPNKAALCEEAIDVLRSMREPTVTYEVDLMELPGNCAVGDTVNIVDDAGELYVSARIIELETSRIDHTCRATLGDFVERDSGISDAVIAEAVATAKAAKDAAETAVRQIGTVEGAVFGETTYRYTHDGVVETVYYDDEEGSYYYEDESGQAIPVLPNDLDTDDDGNTIVDKSMSGNLADIEDALGEKVAKSEMTEYVTQDDFSDAMSDKADTSTVYTKEEIDTHVATQAALDALQTLANLTADQMEQVTGYLEWKDGVLTIGASDFSTRLKLNNSQLAFVDADGKVIAYVAAEGLAIPTEDTNLLRFGVYDDGDVLATNFRQKWKESIQYDSNTDTYDLVFDYIGGNN